MASEYVTLVSAEGFEFVVMRAATDVSPVIKRMLDPKSQFAEAKSGRCTFPEIRFVFRLRFAFAFSFPCTL
jgi:elongin-C